MEVDKVICFPSDDEYFKKVNINYTEEHDTEKALLATCVNPLSTTFRLVYKQRNSYIQKKKKPSPTHTLRPPFTQKRRNGSLANPQHCHLINPPGDMC